MKDFKDWFETRKNLIDTKLEEYLKIKNNPQKKIYESMRYSIFAGGKRIRPILTLACYELFDENIEIPLVFACSVEMIHTYSLIHDDLPALDNDDFRRGNLSCHKKFDEATAILAGDSLLNKAYEIIFNLSNNPLVDNKTILEAGKILASSAGTEGMIGGQIVDLFHKEHNLETLEYMHLRKTGALINASCLIGGVLANADKYQLKTLDEFSKNLGLAFQVRDDILDVEGSKRSLGKSIGKDQIGNKLTYVSYLGIEKAKELERNLTKKSLASLDIFGEKACYLKKLSEFLLNRDS